MVGVKDKIGHAPVCFHTSWPVAYCLWVSEWGGENLSIAFTHVLGLSLHLCIPNAHVLWLKHIR